jgi:hypothetical protein
MHRARVQRRAQKPLKPQKPQKNCTPGWVVAREASRKKKEHDVFDSADGDLAPHGAHLRFLRGREAAFCGICVRRWV